MKTSLRPTLALAGLALLASAGDATAQNAALPSGKSAEAQPVLACAPLGPGFINIPGTTTCLRMGLDILPDIRSDFVHDDLYVETKRYDPGPPAPPTPVLPTGTPLALYTTIDQSQAADRYQQRPNGRVSFTTITFTDGKPIISYVSLRSGFDDNAADIRGRANLANTGIGLEQGWVSAYGFTAGLRSSIFDYSSGYTVSGGYASSRTLNQLAYEHTVAEGATISVALEDNSARRYQDGAWARYGGQTFPDVVLRGRIDKDWGSAHIAGALHPIHDALTGDNSLGWAVNAGLEYKQDWSAVFGDAAKGMFGRFLVTGAYSDGALDYLGVPRFSTDYIVDADGSLVPTKGYSGLVSYEHLWTSNFKTSATLALYRTQATVKDFDWSVQGGVAQIGAEYNPLPGTYVGAEISWFFDQAQAVYVGIDGAKTPVDYLQTMIYLRRSI